MTAARSRTRSLTLAGILAVLAAILTMLYVAHGGGGAKAASGATAPVLVATHDLPVGTSASQALAGGGIVLRHVSTGAFGADALASAAPLRGEVVVQPIYKDEQITARRFGPTGASGIRSVLSGPMRILQVPGDANQLLAGTLQDGDHVDVVASVKQGAQQAPKAGIVLRNLLVLRAPASSSTSNDLSAALQLTDAQAQQLFFVLRNGDWSFVLRPASHASASTVRPTTSNSILAGS